MLATPLALAPAAIIASTALDLVAALELVVEAVVDYMADFEVREEVIVAIDD